MDDVSHILSRVEAGDPVAAAELLPLVYGELRKLAAAKLAHEHPGHSLQATALVHEAYLKLVREPQGDSAAQSQRWDGRAHFFAAAAEAMRRILVDNARRRRSLKRGGTQQRVELADLPAPASPVREDLLALDEALQRLQRIDAQAVQVVHLRYFVGLSIPDAAQMMGISPRTADRLWAFARAWLYRDIMGPHQNEATA